MISGEVMSEADFKRAFNKMKHDLESWRGLIVSIDSVLKWEKNFYPALIFAAISIFFLIIWILHMSTLTMLALATLICVAFDIAYPSISRFLFNSENWDANQEVQFEEVCSQLLAIKMTLVTWYDFVFTSKEKKSTWFVAITCFVLLGLAWIGSIVDNLLLMYTMILSMAMYPGIRKQEVFDNLKHKFGCIVSSKFQQLRESTTKKSD